MTSVEHGALVAQGRRLVEWYMSGGQEVVGTRKQGPPMSSATDVLRERMGLAFAFAARGLGLAKKAWIVGEEDENEVRGTYLELMRDLLRAPPYLWVYEIKQAALSQSSLPEHTVSADVLPFDPMWWTWDTDIIMSEDFDREVLQGLGARIGLTYEPGGFSGWGGTLVRTVPDDEDESVTWLAGYNVYNGPKGLLVHPTALARVGARYPSETGGAYEDTARMLAFLNSPYIDKDRRTAARAHRRQMQRTGAPEASFPEVQFVMLRAGPDEKTAGVDPAGHASRDYRTRWIVSGHFRNQFYASTQSHKVVWVAPYVKGPEGAPLLTRPRKVAR